MRTERVAHREMLANARTRRVLVGAISAVATTPALAQSGGNPGGQIVDSFWNNPLGGLWTEPSNWSSDPRVPRNVGAVEFNVTLADLGAAYAVDLDESLTVQTLAIESRLITLNLRSITLSIAESYEGPGTIRGFGDAAFVIGGTANLASNTQINNLASLSLNGTTTVDGARFEDISLASFNETTSVTGGATFANVTEVSFERDLLLESEDDDFELCDTDVNSKRTLTWSGAGRIVLEQSADLAIDTTGALVITGTGDRELTASGTGESFVLRGLLSADTGGNISFSNAAFINTGVVEVLSGSLETDGVDLANGDQLASGTWRIADGASLSLTGANIRSIATDVELRGANSTFANLDSLEEIAAGGRLALLEGRSFTTVGDFIVADGAELELGAGSSLNITGIFGNVHNGALTGGQLNLAGTINVQGAAITSIASRFTLSGNSAGIMNGAANALSTLELIEAEGDLALVNGASLELQQTLTNAGRLQLGSTDTPNATLAIDADYTQQAGSTLTFLIDNAITGLLTATGTITFGANTTLELVFNTPATFGDTLTLLEADLINGTFDTLSIVGLDPAFTVELTYTQNTLIATVIPGPASGAALALTGLLAARRRR